MSYLFVKHEGATDKKTDWLRDRRPEFNTLRMQVFVAPVLFPIQRVLGALPPEITWLWHETDHSPQYSAKV